MSLIKFMNNIINKNKLVFAFILGLLTCYLIFNYGSCKEGYATKEICLGCCAGQQPPGTSYNDYQELCVEGKDENNNTVWGCIDPHINHSYNNVGPLCGNTKTVIEAVCEGEAGRPCGTTDDLSPSTEHCTNLIKEKFNAKMFKVSVDTTDFDA
jgi:hypothetical protein